MKFAHSFAQMLEEEGFPDDWQAAAIRYRELKKCIKKVQRELGRLGLTADVLRGLVGDSAEGPVFRYMFHGTAQSFQPKLVLTVDAVDGIPLDLNLSEDTRRSLEELVRQLQEKAAVVEEVGKDEQLPGEEIDARSVSTESTDRESICKRSNVRDIEVTLNSDGEFFRLLNSEIASLEALQTRAGSEIKSSVLALGSSVTAIAAPRSRNSKSDLYPWREIFRIYLESGIFFSNLESEQHKERTVEGARERMSFFTTEINRLKIQSKFKNPSSASLFRIFMAVNMEVLKVMKFQAINRTAMTKILKSNPPFPFPWFPLYISLANEVYIYIYLEFDKRTALGARQSFPTFVTPSGPLASQLSREICQTLCTSLLNVIPQLDDYLCPICSSISIKPIRLSCNHIFCVRCLVKLQRAGKGSCPMCRRDCVLQADAGNLDVGLHNFLKEYFPKESKAKQTENEREVAMEQWRNIHEDVFGGSRGGIGSHGHGECIIC